MKGFALTILAVCCSAVALGQSVGTWIPQPLLQIEWDPIPSGAQDSGATVEIRVNTIDKDSVYELDEKGNKVATPYPNLDHIARRYPHNLANPIWTLLQDDEDTGTNHWQTYITMPTVAAGHSQPALFSFSGEDITDVLTRVDPYDTVSITFNVTGADPNPGGGGGGAGGS